MFLGVVNSSVNDVVELLRYLGAKSPNIDANEGDGELGLGELVGFPAVNSLKLSSCCPPDEEDNLAN